MFQIGGNSAENPSGSKWVGPTKTANVTELPITHGLQGTNPIIKQHTEIAASYSRYYHDGNIDAILKLLSPTCQYGTFFGFVWGPTAIRIALSEEQKMNIRFVGKIMHYGQRTPALDNENNNGSGSSSSSSSAYPEGKQRDDGFWRGFPGAAHRQWYGPTDAGLHRGSGAPSFVRVTPNIFERDGYAKRCHRSFPYNILDLFQTLKVRETIIIEDGVVISRVLQNLTAWFPLPYDFM